MISSFIIFAFSQCAFALLGWIFYSDKLFANYEADNIPVASLFCLSFSSSCSLFLLLISEVFSWFPPDDRLLLWSFAFSQVRDFFNSKVIISSIILLPLYQFYLFTVDSGIVFLERNKLYSTVVLYLIFIYLYSCLPSGATDVVSWWSIEANLGKIGVVGVTVMVYFIIVFQL
jgi:hypothetical protein